MRRFTASKLKFWGLLLLVAACQPEPPRVLTASDDLHSLVLYRNQRFSIIPYGIEQFSGTFLVAEDTIQLTYTTDARVAGRPASEALVRKLIINRKRRQLHSVENTPPYFCVYADSNELAALFP